MSEVIGNVRIVIICNIFRKSVPGLDAHGQVAAFEREPAIYPVPAAREVATPTIGLMYDANGVPGVGKT